MTNLPSSNEATNSVTSDRSSRGTEEIFRNLRQKSVKLSNYFGVYDLLFSRFIGKPITVVEIGVMNGGSLFLWREYFGAQARIIGVELT